MKNDGGTHFKKERGTWSEKGRKQALVTIEYLNNKWVTGTFSGDLYVWNKAGALTEVIKAHSGPVNAMYKRHEGEVHKLITASSDGFIIVWDKNMVEKARVNLK